MASIFEVKNNLANFDNHSNVIIFNRKSENAVFLNPKFYSHICVFLAQLYMSYDIFRAIQVLSTVSFYCKPAMFHFFIVATCFGCLQWPTL